MVFIASKEGQLANRIFHASCFIVNAQENNYRLNHLFFDDYYPFFSESLDKNQSPIRFLWKRSSRFVTLLQSLIGFVVKGLLKLKITRLPFLEIVGYNGYQDIPPFDLNDEKFIRKAKSKLVFVSGWLFRDMKNQKKNRQLLLETWQPNKEYRDSIENYQQSYKKNHDLLIGVHVRGGDYKKFEGGKWYYTPDQYYEKMKELASLEIFRNKKIAYIVCSNEKDLFFQDTDKFSVFHDHRHFVEDLYLLSKCDYIIGPPSTFSGWASFYGQVPLYMINEIGTKISDEIFTAKPVTL